MQGQKLMGTGPRRGARAAVVLAICFVATSGNPSRAQDGWVAVGGVQTGVAQPGPVQTGVVQAGGHGTPAGAPGAIQQVGCATCGGGGPLLGPGPGCDGCGGPCYPGFYPCDCCALPGGKCAQLLHGIYQCICCNDPCYEPRWVPLANNAFFIDPARPVTQIKLGADKGMKYQHPDRAELFWAAINQRGPRPNPIPGRDPQPALPVRHVDYQEGYLYTEGAIDRFGMFVNMVYRHSDPFDPIFQDYSGFGDMSIGTKSLLVDCELLQFTFQFVTFLPTGSPGKGLGTGHVSLEPGLLASLKLTPECYLQWQLSYRFPLGGTEPLDGSMLHMGLACNHLLWNCGKDIQVIGTLEANYYCIPDGRYTSVVGAMAPVTAPGTAPMMLDPKMLPGADADIINVGPGVRLVVCNKIDFGIGAALAITSEHLARALVRCEFRWRF